MRGEDVCCAAEPNLVCELCVGAGIGDEDECCRQGVREFWDAGCFSEDRGHGECIDAASCDAVSVGPGNPFCLSTVALVTK